MIELYKPPAIIRPAPKALLRASSMLQTPYIIRARDIPPELALMANSPGAAKARRRVSGLSFDLVASGGDDILAITIPGTPTAGDFCVLFNYAAGGSAGGGLASGFTLLRNDQNSNTRGLLAAKILTGSETTVNGLSNGIINWIAVTFRPSIPLTGFAFNAGLGAATSGDSAAQIILAAGETNLPIMLIGQMASTSISSITISPAMNQLSFFAVHYAHYMIYNIGDTPANHSYNAALGGTRNIQQTGYITFT